MEFLSICLMKHMKIRESNKNKKVVTLVKIYLRARDISLVRKLLKNMYNAKVVSICLKKQRRFAKSVKNRKIG